MTEEDKEKNRQIKDNVGIGLTMAGSGAVAYGPILAAPALVPLFVIGGLVACVAGIACCFNSLKK